MDDIMSLAKIEKTGQVFKQQLEANPENVFNPDLKTGNQLYTLNEPHISYVYDSSEHYDLTGKNDCQWRALSVCLYGTVNGNDQKNVDFVRYFIYSVLKSFSRIHRRYSDYFYIDERESKYKSFEVWIEKFGQGKVWGNNLTLQAFMDGTGINICAIKDKNVALYLQAKKNIHLKNNNFLHLRLKGDERHYANVLKYEKNLRILRKRKRVVQYQEKEVVTDETDDDLDYNPENEEEEEEDDEDDDEDEQEEKEKNYKVWVVGKKKNKRCKVSGAARFMQKISNKGGGSVKNGGGGIMRGFEVLLTNCKVDKTKKKAILSTLDYQN
jgi:hypothetical protein